MMSAGDLIAALQKYDPKTMILIQRCDEDGAYYMAIESAVEVLTSRFEHGEDWNIRPKMGDKGIVKALLLE